MNKFLAVGNLTKDATINEAGTVAMFTLAVTRPFKNKDGKYDSDFMQCRLFGEKTVSVWRERLVKGQKCEIEASFRNNNYKDKDGNTVYDYYFNVERFFPVNGRKEETNNGAASGAPSDSGNGFVNIPDDTRLPWEQ